MSKNNFAAKQCSKCRERKFTAQYSGQFHCILCDDCYEQIVEELKQASIDACYSNGEQEG